MKESVYERAMTWGGGKLLEQQEIAYLKLNYCNPDKDEKKKNFKIFFMEILLQAVFLKLSNPMEDMFHEKVFKWFKNMTEKIF